MTRLLQPLLGLLCALACAVSVAQTVTYFHNDAAGTPLVATDASGNVVWKESYRPYGERQTNAPASSGNPIGYAGKPFDAAIGLSYMGARYYDPVLGRFVAVDPAPADPGSVHGINRYAYASNNPYKYVDPDGRAAETIVDLGFAAYDGGKFLGATAAWVVGKLTGDGNLAAEGATGMRETRGDAGASLVSVIVPGLSAPMLRGAGALGAAKETATVQRWMSKAELEATQKAGLLRGGRDGTHYVTDAANSNALRARQRLALDRTPEVRATLEVPSVALSPASRVNPKFNMPGGGMERTATGNIPARIVGVD